MGKGKIFIKETKLGESRIVPINSELLKVLKSMNNGTKKLFTHNDDYVNRKFKKYLKKVEIKDWKALTIHNLRHTFASHLVMEGTDLYIVSKLLGHNSIAVTQMYAHLASDYLKVSVERLKF
jgi:site-specific recombinase XerD